MWYCVSTACYDDGRVSANIVDAKEQYEKPESAFKSTRRADIYTDWFQTFFAAQEYMEEVRRA